MAVVVVGALLEPFFTSTLRGVQPLGGRLLSLSVPAPLPLPPPKPRRFSSPGGVSPECPGRVLEEEEEKEE